MNVVSLLLTKEAQVFFKLCLTLQAFLLLSATCKKQKRVKCLSQYSWLFSLRLLNFRFRSNDTSIVHFNLILWRYGQFNWFTLLIKCNSIEIWLLWLAFTKRFMNKLIEYITLMADDLRYRINVCSDLINCSYNLIIKSRKTQPT